METAAEHKVRIPAFEGPLDLLLHLIKKDDLDIYDIPIAKILEEYLGYLKLAKELDIDLAGEFLEMAAELAYIKSKMLLPESQEEEEEGPDPRQELMNRLIEYQKYKRAGEWLLARPLLGRDVFVRPATVLEGEVPESFVEPDLPSLFAAFSTLLKRVPNPEAHEVYRERVGVTERIMELMELLQSKGRAQFEDLFNGAIDRIGLIVTFLAILEMSKQGLVRLTQDRVFQSIFVSPLFTGGRDGIETAP